MNQHPAELIDRCWRSCYHDGDVEAVKGFLAAGVDINARAPCSGAAPLDAAIYGGHVELIQYLVDAGADVNGVGYEEATALMAAAYQGDAAAARLLLARGADPLLVHAGSGESALHVVCLYLPRLRGFKSDEGLDPNRYRETVETPADWSRKYYGNDSVRKLLT